MPGQQIAYIRVSSKDQNTARQIEAVGQVGRTFTDKASGKSSDRPQLQACMDYCRSGDTLVVASMDRLARSLKDLLDIVETLNNKGVAVQFIKEGLIFNGDDSPMAKMILGVMGSIAEFERALIAERRVEGQQAAKAAGKVIGKAPLAKEKINRIKKLQAAGKYGKADIARMVQCSRTSVYAVLAGKYDD